VFLKLLLFSLFEISSPFSMMFLLFLLLPLSQASSFPSSPTFSQWWICGSNGVEEVRCHLTYRKKERVKLSFYHVLWGYMKEKMGV